MSEYLPEDTLLIGGARGATQDGEEQRDAASEAHEARAALIAP
jgi:hypothetical protein